MTIYLPLLILFLGLLMFLAAKNNADIKEIGRLSFFGGLLVTLAELAYHVIRM